MNTVTGITLVFGRGKENSETMVNNKIIMRQNWKDNSTSDSNHGRMTDEMMKAKFQG